MTKDEFYDMEIGDVIEVDCGGGKSRGWVIAYTGARVKFDDGTVVDYPFTPEVARNFEDVVSP